MAAKAEINTNRVFTARIYLMEKKTVQRGENDVDVVSGLTENRSRAAPGYQKQN